jgi:adenine deaminase
VLPYLKTKVRNQDLFEVALGKQMSDKVILNGKVVGVVSGEVFRADIAIKGERIALVGDVQKTIGKGTEIINAKDLYLCPGFIDAHVHIESSFLLPEEYGRLVIKKGTTAVFSDPHEIAYVLGLRGIQFMLDRGRNSPVKIFGHVTPKLPHLISGGVETYGVEFDESDVIQLLAGENITSLGEQTFSKFLRSEKFFDVIEKAKQKGVSIEGSAHSLVGEKLNAFISAGIQSDHEAVAKPEAEERLRLGIRLMIREGSTERNLEKTIKALTETGLDSRYACFCTDDKTAEDLDQEGHIDHCIRKSIKLGLAPIGAYQMASLNGAQYYGLDREIGSIGPGKVGDIVFLENLETCRVSHVMSNGKMLVIDGKLIWSHEREAVPEWTMRTVNIKRQLTPDDFKIRTSISDGKVLCRVIGVIPCENLTDPLEEWLKVTDGEILPSQENNILKFSTIERYGRTNGPNIGLGFIKGIKMAKGAIGISVAHDTHNIAILGVSSTDMAVVVNEIARIGGGLAAAADGKVIGSLPLEVAGLMSCLPANELITKLNMLHKDVKDVLGLELDCPFVAISFHSSSGIPKIKVTDKGLVDTIRGKIIPVII